ncbi:MAG TPA: DUF2628 domain-containing protein [Acetobacteraceae bacterium]|jgi:hypothetical protein
MRPGTPPVLVSEGFTWGGLLFGPLWLAAHRAWIPAALTLAGGILIVALTAGATAIALMLALAVWLGVSGHDLRRWSMRHRGFTLFEIVAASDETDAFAKLLERRPDLAGSFLPPGAA